MLRRLLSLEVRVLRPPAAGAPPPGPRAGRRGPGRPRPADRRALAPEAPRAHPVARAGEARPRRRLDPRRRPARPGGQLGPVPGARLLLDDASDADVLARFEVRGDAELRAAMGPGRGAILVGSHLGGHVAALHWLVRRGVPLRLLVQRPRHISRRWTGTSTSPARTRRPGFFLRRDLAPGLATERMLRARSALRDGLAVYLSGDIPWSGPNTRPGRLLGRPQPFLSVWADLAVLTRAPVFLAFCTHLPGGRYALDDRAPGDPRPRRRGRRPSPATSPASNPRWPPTPPTPSPTSSGPATPPLPRVEPPPPSPGAAWPPRPNLDRRPER